MSDNVMSSGLFAVLKTPVLDASDLEELSETMWNAKSFVQINNEGTLLYTETRGSEYGIRFSIHSEIDSSQFQSEAMKHGLEIDLSTVLPYSCYWYNGSNSDMSAMTLERYKKELDFRTFKLF